MNLNDYMGIEIGIFAVKNIISNNNISSNGDTGIRCDGSNNYLVQNKLDSNQYEGIFFRGSTIQLNNNSWFAHF